MNKIPLNDIGRYQKHYIKDVNNVIRKIVDSNIYLRGNEIEKFEEEWARYTGQKYCVACKNGTDALTLSARAMDIKQAFVQGNTLPLTAQGLFLGGAKIDIVDIKNNGRADCKEKNLVPVLLYGVIPNESELNFKLFDAAHAHGWQPPEKSTACWSFYPSKTLGAFGDSGAITTNNLIVYKKLISMVGRDDTLRHPYQINSRMDELQAGILRVKLKYLDDFINARQEIARQYKNLLNKNIQCVSESDKDLNHLFVIKVKADKRSGLINYLAENHIETKIHFPIPLNQINSAWFNSKKLNKTIEWCKEILTLPNFPGMTKKEVSYVAQKINSFLPSN
jgi:dTDP-4-amino-4,6-dideoxygalactose transaminase